MRAIVRLGRETARAAMRHDIAGEAAKMAFFFFLAVFPLVVTVFTVTGIVGGDPAFRGLVETARRIVPSDAWPIVHQLVLEITSSERPGLLSFGVMLTMWAASNGVAALTVGLNRIYAVPEPRPWWKRRLLAFAVLVVTVALMVAGTLGVVPASSLLDALGVGRAWAMLRWPIGYLLVTIAIWVAFRYLPARDQRASARETLIGALVATGLWMAAALAFRVYLARFASYGATYGALGSVIVLMLWFYLDALVVLLGAQVAATLEISGLPARGAPEQVPGVETNSQPARRRSSL